MAPRALRADYERIVRDSERLFRTLDKQGQREYALMLKELRGEVADVYARYAAEDGTLSYAEMQKYDRITSLKNVLNDIVKNRTNNVKARVQSALRGQIRDAYLSSLAVIGDTAGVDLGGSIAADTVTAILQKPVEGLTLAERMTLRTRDLAVRINGATINGFVHQNTFQESAAALKDVAEKGYGRVRTDIGDTTHRVTQDAVKESTITAADKGIETVKVWVTAGDSKVRDAHALLDGQAVRGDEDFVIPSGPWKGYRADAPEGFGEPALDYHCRCFLVCDVRAKS